MSNDNVMRPKLKSRSNPWRLGDTVSGTKDVGTREISNPRVIRVTAETEFPDKSLMKLGLMVSQHVLSDEQTKGFESSVR